MLSLIQLAAHLQYLPAGQERALGRVLSHYTAIVSPNMHSVSELRPQPSNPLAKAIVGFAALPCIAAYINHSCDPNAFVVDRGGVQVGVAGRNIQPGEEITHVYLGHFGDTERQTRQARLLRKYNFQCECEACSQDYSSSAACLKHGLTFLDSAVESLVWPGVTQEELAGLDKRNAELRVMVEAALGRGAVRRALQLTQERVQLMAGALRQPHSLLLLGRLALVNLTWCCYGNRSLVWRPSILPAYF